MAGLQRLPSAMPTIIASSVWRHSSMSARPTLEGHIQHVANAIPFPIQTAAAPASALALPAIVAAAATPMTICRLAKCNCFV